MIGWVWFAVYMTGFVFTYRKLYVAFYEDMCYGTGDGFDVAMSTFLSILLSLFWPIIAVGYLFHRTISPKPPSVLRAELAERERKLKIQQENLAIQEYENGLTVSNPMDLPYYLRNEYRNRQKIR